MTHHNDHVDRALNQLRDRLHPGSHHEDALEQKLLENFTPRRTRTIRRRTPLMLLAVLCLAGIAVASTMVAVRYLQYDIRVKKDDHTLTAPRVLVLPGQTATVTVSDGDNTTSVMIDEDGEVSVESTEDGVTVEYDVTEVEADKPEADPQ